jgi:hypothetical protein
VFYSLVLTWAAVVSNDGDVRAVERETQEEKELNLKKQARGGLFQKWTFDYDHPSETPTGFVRLSSMEEHSADWTVRADATAPSPPNIVGVSSSCATKACYQLLVAEGLEYEYPDLSVRFRALSGSAGVGGLVFGAQDASNFYAAMVDLAALTVQVVRVVAGQQTLLGQAPVSLKPVNWHSLRVQRNTIISKDFIETFVDGSLALSVEDQMLGLGKVGLAVAGESSLLFDTLHAIPLFSHRPFSPPPAY